MHKFTLGGAEVDRKANGSSVSSKKREANRRNAQLSTGPKTLAGKSHSRRNALKHGVLASALLVTEGGRAEDAAEFEELLVTLYQDLAPVGRLEEMLVEKIAVCWWRQKRALLFEAMMIRRECRIGFPDDRALEDRHLLEIIEQAEEVFARHGITSQTEEEDPQADAVFQPHKRSPRRESSNNPVLLADTKDATCYFGLPADEALNRILRYETSIQRQLVHAINQLERLQRARKGEHVPAPMSVQISTDQKS